jgi:hypothetical protein
MRWKLLRRRLSVTAPRMIVRSHLPWPLRWVAVALMLGLSAAVGLWAFEFGKSIAGLDRDDKAELAQLRIDVAALKSEREKAMSVANTAEGLLKAEKVAQEKLAQQLRQTETENLALKNDLGFFERLLPTSAAQGLAVRGLQAVVEGPGRIKYLLLLMQAGKTQPEFQGRCEVTMLGTLDGKAWSALVGGAAQNILLKQSLRLEGVAEFPAGAVVKSISVKVTDGNGTVKATASVKL